MTMKILSRIYELENIVLAAALMVGLTACSGSDETIIDELTPATTDAPKIYTMTVTANKVCDDATRALSLGGSEGKTLIATWTKEDAVQVYHVSNPGTMYEIESTIPDGTLTAQSSGATTTFTGKFTESYTPAAGDVLRLRFLPYPDYTTQEGTLNYIATHCDYALAEITVASVDDKTGNVTATTTAEFQNQQAIVKFSLKQPDGTTPLAATSLKVKVGSTTYNVTPTAAASDIYVAIKKASNKTVMLTANSDYGQFGYDKTGITFESGKYYAVGVKMESRALSKSLSEVTASEIGWRIGSDGVAYEPVGNLPLGVSPVAMIGYISETGHGLAIELNNSPSRVEWAEASSTAKSGKASIKNCTWRLPSYDDWFNILVGCAVNGDQTAFPVVGDTVLNPIHGFHQKYYATGFSLAEAEKTSGAHFWIYREEGEELITSAYEVTLYLYNNVDMAWFADQSLSVRQYVLAVLAF